MGTNKYGEPTKVMPVPLLVRLWDKVAAKARSKGMSIAEYVRDTLRKDIEEE